MTTVPQPHRREPDLFVRTEDGARLAVYEDGTGPWTVILVHGAGSSAAAWTPLTQHLLKIAPAMRIVRADQRGHGRSSMGTAGVSIGMLANDLAAVIEAAAPGPVLLAGHSMGGMAVLALLSGKPHLIESGRVRGVLLAATTPGGPPPARRREFDPAPSTAHGFSTGQACAVAAVCLWRRHSLATVASYLAAMLSAPTDHHLAALAAIPCDVVTGDRDVWTPPSVASALAWAIPGARLRILPGAGHFLPTRHYRTLALHLAGLRHRAQ